MSTAPRELNRIRSVRVPRRMYVSKFQRYGGAAIVVVLAVAVGAGILPKADRQERLEEKRRLERETWCDVGDGEHDDDRGASVALEFRHIHAPRDAHTANPI